MLKGDKIKRKRTKSESRPKMTDVIAGAVGGSIGVIATCPLDVIQTRLQSSAFRMQRLSYAINLNLAGTAINIAQSKPAYFRGLLSYASYIARSEGVQALFKGLTPTLLAVTPSRAIYFSTYKIVKDYLNLNQTLITPHSSGVYLTAGCAAQFVNSTVTNPLWFVKTRLQLNFSHGKETSLTETVRQAYQENGIRTFYRGLRASYLGMAEVALHFTCYEHIKKELLKLQGKSTEDSFIVLECTTAAGAAKVISTGLCYPYEVIRTRLRQQESNVLGEQRYRTCLQTLRTIIREEKLRGLYGGMGTSLIKQVPFITIMFCTYEGTVFLMERWNDS